MALFIPAIDDGQQLGVLLAERACLHRGTVLQISPGFKLAAAPVSVSLCQHLSDVSPIVQPMDRHSSSLAVFKALEESKHCKDRHSERAAANVNPSRHFMRSLCNTRIPYLYKHHLDLARCEKLLHAGIHL